MKPRNRPSFKHILMHVDIAAVEILSVKPDDYFKTQKGWKKEVMEHNERMQGEDPKIPMAEHSILLRKRKEELKHAEDIKKLYETKLQKVNDLYVELSRWKLQLEEMEKSLARRERQLNLQGPKAFYKKKLRQFKTPERFQPRSDRSQSANNRSRQSSPSTPEVLSTSPETPFKMPPMMREASAVTTAQNATTSNPPVVVRANPIYNLCDTPKHFAQHGQEAQGASGVDWSKLHRVRFRGHGVRQQA